MPFSLSKYNRIENCVAIIYVNGEEFTAERKVTWRAYGVDILFSSILNFVNEIELITKSGLSEKAQEQLYFASINKLLMNQEDELDKFFKDNPRDFQGLINWLQSYLGVESFEEIDQRQARIEDIKEEILALNKPKEIFIDLEKDGKYIYPSFLQDYNINLLEAKRERTMDWQEFQVLLGGLSENTKFRKVIEIRQMEIPKDSDKKTKENILEAKKAVSLGEVKQLDLKEKRKKYYELEAELVRLQAEIEEVENGK